MFERIKCYRNLKKAEKALYDLKHLAEMSNDTDMVRDVNEIIYMNEHVKKKMWFNRKMAKDYNISYMIHGF